MVKIRLLELFGGIGACTQALLRVPGVELEIVDYVEIDRHAVASYNAINGTSFEPQDISLWDKDVEVDLVMHGSPCQDISVAGLQAGADKGSGTRSSLMYESLRIIGKLRPRYVVWENVKNLLSERHRPNFDAYLEAMAGLGYTSSFKVLNSRDFGVPQNRERVFTVSVLGKDGFDFPQGRPTDLRLKDILEPHVDERFYYPPEYIDRLIDKGRMNRVRGGHIDTGSGLEPSEPSVLARRRTEFGKEVRKRYEAGELDLSRGDLTEYFARDDGVSNTLTTVVKDNMVVEPTSPKVVKIGRLSMSQDGWVYDPEGLAPTHCAGHGNTPKLLELTSGQHQGGRVYDPEGLAPTHCAGNAKTLVAERVAPSGIMEVTGGVSMGSRVYDPEGLAPTQMAGRNQVKILSGAAMRGRDDGRQHIELNGEGISNALTTVQKNALVAEIDGDHVRRFERIGYKVMEDGHIRAYDTVKGSGCQEENVNGPDAVSLTLTTAHCARVYEGDPACVVGAGSGDLRIRRLTPLECWRLMGQSDEAFHRAEKVSSQTQLYKQAGNSIVVDVLVAVFGELFSGTPRKKVRCTTLDDFGHLWKE